MSGFETATPADSRAVAGNGVAHSHAGKRQDIELFRIISTFAIVWYHSGAAGRQVAYSGLIVFIIISLLLESNRKRSNARQFLKERAVRLLLPWLAWISLYGVANLVAGNPVIHLDKGIILGILAGTSVHLWYLPFIYTCLVLYVLVFKEIEPKLLAFSACAIFAVSMIETPMWRPVSLTLGYPLAQYAHASAGFFLALFLANAKLVPHTIMALGAAVSLASSAAVVSWPGVGLPYFASIIVGVILAFKWLNAAIPFDLGRLSQYCFGIYLSHIAVLSLTTKASFALNLNLGNFIPAVVFSVSLLAVFTLKQLFPRIARYLI